MLSKSTFIQWIFTGPWPETPIKPLLFNKQNKNIFQHFIVSNDMKHAPVQQQNHLRKQKIDRHKKKTDTFCSVLFVFFFFRLILRLAKCDTKLYSYHLRGPIIHLRFVRFYYTFVLLTWFLQRKKIRESNHIYVCNSHMHLFVFLQFENF